jgi:hypothetical protein
MSADQIIRLLEDKGPLTGAQLVEATGMEVFSLWSACKRVPEIQFELVGKRFLRLDRAVQDFARLSPSIRREFLTYTLLGLESQEELIRVRAASLKDRIRSISAAKLELARESVNAAVNSLGEKDEIFQRTCFVIAGDVVYDMSHTVPRPEKSTGEMVRGSDLDIIGIVDDGFPEELFKALDKAIHKRKHFLLVHPEYREEIDYILKNLTRVREQVRFNVFESMVACKILHEGNLLLGSESVFGRVKRQLEEANIPQKLDEMERSARLGRDDAERQLLDLPANSIDSRSIHLFYTREEGDEIY